MFRLLFYLVDPATLAPLKTTVLVSLVNGKAVLTRSDLSPASHNIQAEYMGDGGYDESDQDSIYHFVRHGVSLELVSSKNPQMVGNSVTFTVTLSSSGRTPSMNVTFKDGDTVLGSVSPAGGIASLLVSNLALGNHNIRAYYPGDESISDGVSNLIVQRILTSIFLPLTLR